MVRRFLKIHHFWPKRTICISNESWKHSIFKFAIKSTICYKKISSKIRKKIMKNQCLANFSTQIVFFYVKFAFRMFSAFIWYTYCPCRSKMMNFQKLLYQKPKNFRGQSRLLRRHLTAKLCNLEWCSKTLQADKDASFHLRWCLGWFAWKLTIQEHENHCGRIPPPPAFRQTKSSGSFRVNVLL